MTNREAIRILTLERDDWETSHCTPMKRKEAFEMAIAALEKEAWKEEHPVSPLQPCKQDDLISKQAAQPETHEKRTETHSCDCISRQAVLSFLRTWQGVDGYNWGERNIICAAINEVEALPSAQPEPSQVARDIATIIENEQDMRVIERNAQPDLIRCKDCRFWQNQEEGVVEVPICARPENKYEKLPFRFMIGEDGFCSFAERRTDDKKTV